MKPFLNLQQQASTLVETKSTTAACTPFLLQIKCGFLFLCLLLIQSCGGEQALTPKPRAYPKIEYPERRYQLFDQAACSFEFEYPTYARIVKNPNFLLEDEVDSACWFDLYYPSFNGRLHCTYYEIEGQNSFDQLKKDVFKMSDFHNVRANYIDELAVSRQEANVEGLLFAIDGPAATPFQFFLSDKEDHFFRGALYFDTQVRPDSIAPIYEFVREDILKMIESFEWVD